MLQYLFFWLIRAQMGHYHQTWVFVAFLGQYDSQQLSKTDKQPKQHIQQSWFMTAYYCRISYWLRLQQHQRMFENTCRAYSIVL